MNMTVYSHVREALGFTCQFTVLSLVPVALANTSQQTCDISQYTIYIIYDLLSFSSGKQFWIADACHP